MYVTNAERASRASDTDAPRVPLAMSCAECKAILRTVYFNLDERPLCPRCAQGYRTRIERGTGPGSLARAALYGGGAAFAGMLGVALLLMVVGAFRILASFGVAYLVSKAIGKATANYGGRRYQILAVSLTYLALGLAMLMPVIRAASQMSEIEAPPRSEARTGPAGQMAEINDELNSQANPINDESEDEEVVAARTDSIAYADSVMRLEQTRENLRASDGNMSAASRLAGGAGAAFVGALVLLVMLPIMSAFWYGIYAGVLSIFGMIWAMKRAWDLTALVTDYELTGPYNVGEGPIAPTIGR